jgi:hypothetical protein
MITFSKVAVTAAAAALTATGAFAQAASASTPVTKCPVGATCVTWQDTNTTGTQQDIELNDHLGSPIVRCNNSGGCWVGNDRLGVTGSSVFNLAVYLSTTNGTNGELVIDGQVLTGSDIAFVTCLNEGGTIAACRTSAAAAASRPGVADHRSRAIPAAASTPVTPCPVGATCVTWQDTNTTGSQKDIELLDHTGSPIFWCDNSGGCWVRNDKLGVTGSSVFNLAAYLSTTNGTNGELVIDGQVLTGPDIAFVNCLHGGGTIAACRTS